MRLATTEEIEALPYSEPFQNGSLSLFYTPLDDEFMAIAKIVLAESTDRRRSTAAVVVKDGKVLSMAANQSGFKYPWLIRLHELGVCVRKLLRTPSGQGYHLCPGCAKHEDHAESRASRIATEKHPEKVTGSTLYLVGHFWCCKPCCDAMIKAGVTRVVLVEGVKD